MPSKRVLKMTFEFHVPEGLEANIRFSRIEAAAAAFETTIRTLASTVFPWANRIVINREWSYRWWNPEPIDEKLPETDKNVATAPGDTQRQALEQAILTSAGDWDAARSVEALAAAGYDVTDKRARDLLRQLAADGVIDKGDGGRAVYRRPEED